MAVITYGQPGTPPPAAILAAFEGERVNPVAWVDVYLANNTTAWAQQIPITDGKVSVDMGRDERRNLDLTFYDLDQVLGYGPGQFWFDKILKPFKGIALDDGSIYAYQLGEFMIDQIERPHFPRTVHVTCRDFVKKLKLAKFTSTTTFTAGTQVKDIIFAIATNGGVSKFNIANITTVLAADITFERGTPRWDACKKLAESISCDLYFDSVGFFTLALMVDPITAPLAYSFKTGTTGNMVSFTKSSTDNEMFNDVLVYGDGPDNPLVFAQAENNNVTSPTRISEIGRRTTEFKSQFLDTNAKAATLAGKLLSVSALEQYQMSLESISIPWLEAARAVEVLDPNAAVTDPTRFLLTDFEVGFQLGSMQATAKRVTIVG